MTVIQPDPDIVAVLAAMPIVRLAHFTPSRNLPHILDDGVLRSVKDMADDARACYAPTDLLRLDGLLDKVCCSLQYPNGYYFAKAVRKPGAVNYPDWVCLMIDKMAAAAPGTLFCPRNAAAGANGCVPGIDGLTGCYAQSVTGQGGLTRYRGPRHDPGSPTDVQAEVLITAPIPLSAVRAIVVPTTEAAVQEFGRLSQLGLSPPHHITWTVCAEMFDKHRIASAVCNSNYLMETPWSPSSPGVL